jgi:polysaccharide export outer membrane protein
MLKGSGWKSGLVLLAALILSACGSSTPVVEPAAPTEQSAQYRIGAGDELQIFVWRNPDLSITLPVRPDGKISTPLVEDMQAVGKTPTQLSRDMEVVLSEFVKSPSVNIIVMKFVGTFGDQIRVVGQATEPKTLSYRDDMTLLDVMIEVGGLSPGAAGNRAKIVRRYGGQAREIDVRISDLVNKGKISANIEMMPGDVLIIPESRF